MLITISQRHSTRDVKRPSLVLFVLGDVVKWNSSKAKRKMIGDIIEAVGLSGFFPSSFLYLFGTASEIRPPVGTLMSVLTVLDCTSALSAASVPLGEMVEGYFVCLFLGFVVGGGGGGGGVFVVVCLFVFGFFTYFSFVLFVLYCCCCCFWTSSSHKQRKLMRNLCSIQLINSLFVIR